MDSSQRTRMINEAANVYLSRNKPVDSSLLTFKRLQLASYSGNSKMNTPPYYNGQLVVNPILSQECPVDHAYTDGYSASNNLSQNECLANSRAGAAICGEADYSTAPPGIFLLNPSTCSTILNAYNNNTPQVSVQDQFIKQIILRKLGPLNSMRFNGNAFALLSTDSRLTENASYNGSSDFTIEFFIRPTTPSNGTADQNIFYIGNDASVDTYRMIGKLVYVSSGKYTFNLQVSTFAKQTFGDFYLDTWYHIAIQRKGGLIKTHVNGTLINNVVITPNIPASGSTSTTYFSSRTIIGAAYAGSNYTNGFTGYLSNFRWIKGKALYSEPVFEVPNTPFPGYLEEGAFWPLQPYHAVLLTSSSSAAVITNTGNPPSGSNQLSVSVTDGSTYSSVSPSITYDSISWTVI